MYLINTNIHAAFLLQNYETDSLTRQYLQFFNQILLADRVIPDFILGEFETFIMQVVPSRYRLNPSDTKRLKQLALDYMHNLTYKCTLITPEVQTVQKARDLYIKNAATLYISFVDCLSLATAKQNKLILFTKDKRLKNIAKDLEIEYYEPK